MEAKFSWNKAFASRWNGKFTAMQTTLDKSVMKYMNQYVPVASNKYRNAGKLKGSISNPEPGRIIYQGSGKTFSGEPISRHAYYTPMSHLRSGNPQATHKWFETMKVKDLNKIRSELSKAGG
jgi:hypothetical protein